MSQVAYPDLSMKLTTRRAKHSDLKHHPSLKFLMLRDSVAPTCWPCMTSHAPIKHSASHDHENMRGIVL